VEAHNSLWGYRAGDQGDGYFTRLYRTSRDSLFSLRNGFTAYALLSPATNSSCHRRRRIKLTSPPLDLAPATGVGTTRFCRTQPAPFVLRAGCSLTGNPPCDHHARRRCRVHRIPSRVRDDGQRPSCRERTGRAGRTDLPDSESEIFLLIGLDRANRVDGAR
jgi:hypothetical protein